MIIIRIKRNNFKQFFGIYFYICTSPKRLKKEVMQKTKTDAKKKEDSPMTVVETKKENKFEVIEELDLEPTKEYNKSKDL